MICLIYAKTIHKQYAIYVYLTSILLHQVVRLKRNYEQPHDLEFHAGDDDGLVRVKRQRRDVITTQDEEPSLVRVKRMKRDVNSVRDETEPGLMRVKRDDEELQRVKRTKRDIEQALQR